MISPVALSVMLILAWRLSTAQLERLPPEGPRDAVTETCFRRAYLQMVCTASMHATLVAVLALTLAGMDLAPGVRDITLATIGLALTPQPAAQALQAGRVFAAMKADGRGEEYEVRDYMPSLVLAPLAAPALGMIC